MKTHWNRTKGGLEPASAETEDWLAKKACGVLIEAETKEPRNGKFHRLFFALVNLVFQNQEVWPTQELLLVALKIGAGHYTANYFKLPDGQVVMTPTPKSISFAKMDETEFSKFFDRICDVVIKDYWADMTREEIKADVAEIVGIGALT